MGPLAVGLLAGAGMGLLQSKAQADKDRKNALLQSAIARYSPWTGIQPSTEVSSSNPTATIGAGALSGLAQGQAYQAAQNQEDFQNKQLTAQNNLAAAQAKYYDQLNRQGQY